MGDKKNGEWIKNKRKICQKFLEELIGLSLTVLSFIFNFKDKTYSTYLFWSVLIL